MYLRECLLCLTCDKHRDLRLDGTVVPVQGADDGRGDEIGEDDQVAPFQPLIASLATDIDDRPRYGFDTKNEDNDDLTQGRGHPHITNAFVMECLSAIDLVFS